MREQVIQALQGLPQFDRIRRADAQRWLNHVIKTEPTRALWLLERQGAGFGGTEIGPLLLDAMDRPAPFRSAAELSNEKLMRLLPTPTTRHMKKGVLLEQAVKQATLRLYGGREEQDTLEAFQHPHPNDPFGVAGNPDFPWERPDGTRIMTDIKVPASGTDGLSDAEKDFCYMTQLNTYSLLAERRGVEPFDQLMNIQLELPPVITDAYMDRLEKGGADALEAVVEEMTHLLKYEREGMRLKMTDQPINPPVELNGQSRPLYDLIEDVAGASWQAVLDGNVPSVDTRADIDLDEEQKADLAHHEDKLLRLRALQEQTDQQIQAEQQSIDTLLSAVTTEGAVAQSPHVNIKRVSALDREQAEHLLQRHNVDLDSVRKERKKLKQSDHKVDAMRQRLVDLGEPLEAFLKPAPLDTQKVLNALADAGENPARVVTHQTQFSKSQKKATANALTELRERLKPVVAHASEAPEQQQDNEQSRERSTSQTVSTPMAGM